MRVILNWFAGWRRDCDGWLVRARRVTDPDLNRLDRADIGFIEESSIAVRDHRAARLVDAGRVA